MKTILVDGTHVLIVKGEGIFQDMYEMLETFENPKIILTNANKSEKEKFGFKRLPYEIFSLENHPRKKDPAYFEMMLQHFDLSADDVIYFEHNPDAVESAKSIGIKTFWYDPEKKDLPALQKFLEANV